MKEANWYRLKKWMETISEYIEPTYEMDGDGIGCVTESTEIALTGV